MCDGIAARIIYHMYDMVDEFPMGNYSLTDIINLKQLIRLFFSLLGATLLLTKADFCSLESVDLVI